ncbi:MAG: hypothetical protein ABIL58_16935 [Pseudomonadota bacterium]
MAHIVVVSSTRERLAAFTAALKAAGAQVQLAPTAEAALAAAKKTSPVLMVIDQSMDRPAFALVKEILSINALINTAVISAAPEADFHDTAEGLGILMQLPDPPGAADAAALWQRLSDLGAVAPAR